MIENVWFDTQGLIETISNQKRKLENDLATIRADLDEAHVEIKNSEERYRNASNDAARLIEELRAEQVHFNV